MSEYILEMEHISKSFSRVKVLDDVSLKVRAGEVHAIVGENGAGKSTLMKILTGVYSPDGGEIRLHGKKVEIHNPRMALAHGIAMIYQELNPVLDQDVAENIFLGRELIRYHFGPLSIVDKQAQHQHTQELFARMGVDIPSKALMRQLSVAQKQLVEIVKAISLSCSVVVMDEPTSALTEKEVATLFEQIEKLRSQGVAIIYISHRLEEVFKIADTITVLRDGRLIGTDSVSNFDHDKLIRMMVGRNIEEFYPKQNVPIGEVVLEVRNLSLGKRFRNISFQLHAGEILGIAGLVGAGRSELAECIFGLSRPTTGEVYIRGKRVDFHHPQDSVRHRVAMITEDRKLTGLNLKASVEHNITLVALSRLSRLGIIDSDKEAQVTDTYIKELSIRTFSRKTLVANLSGGNQQKVVLAKWLLTEPDIIIMDEPTRGIDVGAKRDIYLLMGSLAAAGKAILMVSSELPEIMGLADRVIVLAAGNMTGELARHEFSQEAIMRYASEFRQNG